MSKVMVVTGASRGIGAAIAQRAAREGWQVCINYRSAHEQARALVRRIEEDGGRAVAIAADVSRDDEAAKLFREVDALLGPVSALVNNAGIVGGQRALEAIDEALLSEVFATNVFSVFHCSREAVRRMSTRHGGTGGVIVNMSSAAARHGGLPDESFYAASKGAVDSLTVALAKQHGRDGVRINALRPGLIETEIHEAHGGAAAVAALAAGVPLAGRAGSADEVAQAALWLAGDASSYVHGALVDVSGGR